MFYKYKITIEDYNKMFEDQKGCCDICGIHQSELTKALAIDHCHTTNKIRGLLCSNCNLSIGVLNENINTLYGAIKYLEKHNKVEPDLTDLVN